MWYTFALLSSVFYAGRSILEKKIIHKVDKYILGFAIRLFAVPFFVIPLIIQPTLVIPIQTLPWQFWVAASVVALIHTPIEMIFYVKALQEEEVSLVLPILALAPALTVLWGALFLKEIPSVPGVIGIIIMLAGIYLLKIDAAKEGFFEPLRHLKNNKGVKFMLIVMLSQSISAIFDKIGVIFSNAAVYGLVDYIGVTFTLFVVVLFLSRHHLKQLFTHAGGFFVIGLLIAAYTLLYFFALQSGFVGYVTAIKSSSVIFIVIFGYLFLKEKNIKQKLFSSLFIFAGLLLIKVFS